MSGAMHGFRPLYSMHSASSGISAWRYISTLHAWYRDAMQLEVWKPTVAMEVGMHPLLQQPGQCEPSQTPLQTFGTACWVMFPVNWWKMWNLMGWVLLHRWRITRCQPRKALSAVRAAPVLEHGIKWKMYENMLLDHLQSVVNGHELSGTVAVLLSGCSFFASLPLSILCDQRNN